MNDTQMNDSGRSHHFHHACAWTLPFLLWFNYNYQSIDIMRSSCRLGPKTVEVHCINMKVNTVFGLSISLLSK